LRGLDL